MLAGWLGAVKAPNDHRDLADITLGDPADIVLVVPRRDARGAAEVAAFDLDEPRVGSSHRARIDDGCRVVNRTASAPA
jgi:hypothetical protein